MFDSYGRKTSEVYKVLSDPFFERRLKAFDPRLKLMFDQRAERWVILEEAYDNSGFNCIIKCEWKDTKLPRPLGDWVFEKLYKYRQMYNLKRDMGVDGWLNSLKLQSSYEKKNAEEKASEDNQLLIRDEILQWRKASKEIQNLPVADATAGYPKV